MRRPSPAASMFRTALTTVLFTGFVAATYGFGLYLFPAIMSDMRADLGLTYLGVGVITATAQAAFLATALSAGPLSHRIGAPRLVVGSVVLCGLCLAGLAVADTAAVAGALLAILGACTASVWVPMVAVVGRVIDARHRAKALGLISSGTNYGIFVNGLIVPYLLGHHGWRSVWGVTAALTLALAVAARAAPMGGQGGRAGDAPGAGGPSHRFKHALTPRFALLSAISFMGGLGGLPFLTYFSAFLREELGLSATLAGQAWSVIGLVGMGSGFVLGALADRIGIRAGLCLAYLLVVAAAALACLHDSPGQILAAAALFGLSFFAIYGLIPAYISKTAPADVSATIFGVATTALGVGAMVGNFIGGWSKSASGTFFWLYVGIAAVFALMTLPTLLLASERTSGAEDLAPASPKAG